MDGWSIDDQEGGSKPFYIYNEKVVSRGFLLLPSWKTKISLNNSEDSVRLFDGDGKIKETVVYEDAKENYSYARKENNEFDWTPVLTPLSKNIIKTDEELSANDEKTTTAKAASKSTTAKTINNGDLSDTIFITEVFPNPKGTDKGNEWVEIYNDSEEIVNLGGWYIDLGEGSTKKYIFENIEINSQEYSVLSDTEMSLTLKNSDGELRLLDFEDKAVDSITYQSAAENSSYMKVKITGENGDEYEWKWTTNVTKGEENQTLYKYKGIISMLDEKTGSLELTLAEKNDKTEKISAKIIQGGDNPLFDELKNGAEVELILSKSETGDFILDDFNIINGPAETSQNNDSGLVYIILSSLPPAGLLGYYGIKKFGLIKIITS